MQQSLKRVIDMAGAAIGLVITAPVLALAAAAVRLKMGKPSLFHQARGGLNGRVFHVHKFRTMMAATGPPGSLLPDTDRLTPLGRFIRNTSIDELPQLWNVLRGDMSLVGPRPLLTHYLPRYDPVQARRHEVKPGITGWAQVNGRNALGWEQKFELDVWYVDNWSLWLDGKILWLTLVKVLSREGVSRGAHATMPEFMGSHGFGKGSRT